MIPIKIKEISVCHGNKVVDNTPYLEHFKKQGKDVEHFLRDVIGRDKRYLFDSEEDNSLTYGILAAKDVLKKAGYSGSDIDLIVFSSQLPEYIAPPCCMHVHHAIGGKSECICYDMNVNCAGMTIALEQISKYMSVTPSVNKALIVGCDFINMTVDPNSEYTYGHYGDASCAYILEKTEEPCGLIDSVYDMKSEEHNNILFPGCGFSKLFKVKDPEELRLRWIPFDSNVPKTATEGILKILKRNNLQASDVKMFCLSQYVYKNIEKIREILGVEASQSLYIGDEYGYTGTTSPFIVLYEAVKRGMVKRGDKIVFWTVGAGAENITVLYQY
jgi:3-oxoacyl-[acyl-carrier-protein] synthase-3